MLKFAKKYKTVLFIKNVQIFAEETRQTFLYSLMDEINSYCESIMVVFSTKNIFFDSKLEKRVKSRFTHIAWHFYNMELADLTSIIKLKLDIPEPTSQREIDNRMEEERIDSIKVKTFKKIMEMMIDSDEV